LRALNRALDSLPLDQRVAFVLCDVEERTSGEAAELAGAPEATLRTRLFHARKKLRTALTKEGIQ
jgi:RNA polymerase sigma-70 factor (ECF subfamily)